MNYSAPVELTRQLVRIPSVNPMRGVIDPSLHFEHRVTDFLEATFRGNGWPVFRQLVDQPLPDVRQENILAFVEGGPNNPTVMLEVHQDTVPVTGMTIDPFAAELNGDRIYGRGACDVKGGMATLIVTTNLAMQLPKDERPNIILACTINEENGFSGAYKLRELWSSGECPFLTEPPDAIIVTEPTELDVVVAHKGVVRWKIRTLGKAGHSSAPDRGENAIYAMARVISRLEDYAQNVVGELSRHPLVGKPTLSVGTIEGGISVNSIPDVCEIHIDRRLCPSESPSKSRDHVMQYLRSELPDLRWEITDPDIISPGLDGALDSPLANQLTNAAKEVGVESKPIGVLYGTDAAVLGNEGIPTVVFGPGSIEQAHTADEWIDIEQLRKAVEVLTQFVTSY